MGLPIIAVDNVDEAIEKANAICDRPLALYVYSEDPTVTNKVLNGTLSGGAAVNTCFEQLINANLPFGGVGASGMGSYHGKYGFDEFTHKRSVLHQDSFLFKGSPLPDNPSDMIYDYA